MKVLIVRLSAMGDVIQGIPCMVALKESFPSWEISWLVEESSAPLLRGHPHLSKLFVLARDWRKKTVAEGGGAAVGIKDIFRTWRALQKENFDIAIDLQGLLKSGLWTLLSGAHRRLGYDKTREGAHYFLNEYVSDRPTFDPDFPLVSRYLEPARFLGADMSKARYVLPSASAEIQSGVDLLMGKRTTPTVAFSPCSAWPSKNWPVEKWANLARSMAGYFQIVLTGSNADHETCETIAGGLPGVINFAGKTPLLTLAEVFRRCALVIGPDTGPLHLANATGIPKILMIFGSTSQRRSGPYGKGHHSLALDLSCQPCFERLCPLGHHGCLNQLQEQEVLKAALHLIWE